MGGHVSVSEEYGGGDQRVAMTKSLPMDAGRWEKWKWNDTAGVPDDGSHQAQCQYASQDEAVPREAHRHCLAASREHIYTSSSMACMGTDIVLNIRRGP